LTIVVKLDLGPTYRGLCGFAVFGQQAPLLVTWLSAWPRARMH
jgi:hypothetical protein